MIKLRKILISENDVTLPLASVFDAGRMSEGEVPHLLLVTSLPSHYGGHPSEGLGYSWK